MSDPAREVRSSVSVMPPHAARGATRPRWPAPVPGAVAAWIVAATLLATLLLIRAGGGTDARRDDGRGDAAPRHAPRPLFSREELPLERVDRIEVRRGDLRLVFERDGDGWAQRVPYAQPADGARIRELLVRIADLRVSRSMAADAVDPRAIGMDPALAELHLSWPEGSRRVALGQRGVGGRAWLRVDDGPVHAAEPAAHESILDADPRQWRSWRIFDAVGDSTDRILVHRTPLDRRRDAQVMELRRQEGRWQMISPWRTRVDDEVAAALVGALGRVEHAGFLDDSPADPALYGLEWPIAAVEVWSARRETAAAPSPSSRRLERIEIGSGVVQGGAVPARRTDRPPVMLLDQTALAALLPAPVALVDPRACGVPAADLRALRVRNPDGTLRFSLERTLEGWLLREPGGMASDAEGAPEVVSDGERVTPAIASNVQALIETLTTARAPELAPQPMPDDLVVALVEVVPSLGPPVVVRVAREGPAGKWALDESDNVLRIFPASMSLALDAASFRASLTRPQR